MIEIIFMLLPWIVFGVCLTGPYLYDDLFMCPTFEPRHYLPETKLVRFHSRFMGLAFFRWTYRLCEPLWIRSKLRLLIITDNDNPFLPKIFPPYWSRMWPHHAVNFMIHGMTTCMLYWFLLYFFSVEQSRLASFIFCVHPIQSGSVCYLSARSGMLAFLFALSTIHLVMQGQWEVLPLALVSGLLSRFSKEEGPLDLLWLTAILMLFGSACVGRSN